VIGEAAADLGDHFQQIARSNLDWPYLIWTDAHKAFKAISSHRFFAGISHRFIAHGSPFPFTCGQLLLVQRHLLLFVLGQLLFQHIAGMTEADER